MKRSVMDYLHMSGNSACINTFPWLLTQEQAEPPVTPDTDFKQHKTPTLLVKKDWILDNRFFYQQDKLSVSTALCHCMFCSLDTSFYPEESSKSALSLEHAISPVHFTMEKLSLQVQFLYFKSQFLYFKTWCHLRVPFQHSGSSTVPPMKI